MENPKIENQPQETQGKTTNTTNNNHNTQINNTTILKVVSNSSIGTKAGVNAWSINPQITKPASTSTGVPAAEILES